MCALAPQSVVDFLRQPSTYPDNPKQVEVVETHLSWVFLTDRFAYKLKKPIQYPFVDFTQPAARHKACLREVGLNRRLAEDIYLAVLPVDIDGQGHLALEGNAQPLDWVVKMRRLRADQTLEQLILDHRLTDEDINRVAVKLADFFARAAPAAASPKDFRQIIGQHIRENADELASRGHEVDASLVSRIHAAQMRFLRLRRELFDSRVCDGRIIEGHGDLRPEHIYIMEHQVAIIDCVEFSAELRTLDAVDDLSFLAMECDRIGAGPVGRRVLETYRHRSGDNFPETLLCFYMSYRACVRAKVAALRAGQLPPAASQSARNLVTEYLALADGCARRLGPPLMLVVHGLMGTGKSTVARALADELSLKVLSTDSVRQELFQRSTHPASFNEGLYSPELRKRVYDELLERASSLVRMGQSVVLDGTFLANSLRQATLDIARHMGALPLLIHCHCDRTVAAARIAARLSQGISESEARPDLIAAQQQENEALSPDMPQIELDTSSSLDELVSAVIGRIASALDE